MTIDWIAMLGPPLLALLNQEILYVAAPRVWHAVPAVLLALTIGLGVIAWRRRHARFLAAVGTGSSALFALVIVAEWMALFLVGPYR